MKNAGVVFGIGLLLYSVVLLWQSFSLDYYTSLGPGPGFFPLWLSIVLLILSLVYIWQSIKKEVFIFKQIIPKGKDLKNVLAVLASVPLFMVLVDFTGFNIASTLLLSVILIRHYKWYQGIGIAIVASGVLFYIFKTLLEVPLPVNAFGW